MHNGKPTRAAKQALETTYLVHETQIGGPKHGRVENLLYFITKQDHFTPEKADEINTRKCEDIIKQLDTWYPDLGFRNCLPPQNRSVFTLEDGTRKYSVGITLNCHKNAKGVSQVSAFAEAREKYGFNPAAEIHSKGGNDTYKKMQDEIEKSREATNLCTA